MIVHSRPTLRELFTLWNISIVPRILSQIVATAVFAGLVTWFHVTHPEFLRNFSVAPFTLLGIALSIFLGFRNSACYDRWWEARRQVGSLVGEVRSLARLTLSLQAGDRPRRTRAVHLQIQYVYALKAHLRGEPVEAAISAGAPTSTNLPDAILRLLAADYADMLHAGEFGEPIFQRLDERLSAIAAIQAACERLRSTPVPFTYTLLLHRTAYAFCFLIPFGLAGTLGWATPIFTAVVAYAFFGLDELGTQLEEPFGDCPNALALSALARTVEISLLEALGETPPAPLKAEHFILR